MADGSITPRGVMVGAAGGGHSRPAVLAADECRTRGGIEGIAALLGSE